VLSVRIFIFERLALRVCYPQGLRIE